MHNTPKSTLRENINELQAQGYEVDKKNQPVSDNIPNPDTHQDTPTKNPWG